MTQVYLYVDGHMEPIAIVDHLKSEAMALEYANKVSTKGISSRVVNDEGIIIGEFGFEEADLP